MKTKRSLLSQSSIKAMLPHQKDDPARYRVEEASWSGLVLAKTCLACANKNKPLGQQAESCQLHQSNVHKKRSKLALKIELSEWWAQSACWTCCWVSRQNHLEWSMHPMLSVKPTERDQTRHKSNLQQRETGQLTGESPNIDDLVKCQWRAFHQYSEGIKRLCLVSHDSQKKVTFLAMRAKSNTLSALAFLALEACANKNKPISF